MKIVFTGGGTGGHFYPVIAVVEGVNKALDREKIIGAELFYFSDTPYDEEILFANNLKFVQVSAGKIRTYFSILNFFDLFKTAFGVFSAIIKLYKIYPDVVFGKGGYSSFPTILAAKILRIPVIIHESDSAPGRVNMWAGKFAQRIAVSFKEAVEFFPKNKVAWTGHPIRIEIGESAPKEKALEHFKLESNLPVILILGGSQGAELINQTVLDALPILLPNFQIIHQTGIKNFVAAEGRAGVILGDNPIRAHYVPVPYLNNLSMKMASGAASLIISRAGSSIFEIASWGIPSILIPITNTNRDHQKNNAFAYARAGACEVIEEMNLTDHILNFEILKIMGDKIHYENMAKHAKAFYKPDAAEKIAEEIMTIAMSHEEE